MTHFGTTKGGKDIDCVTLSAGDIAVKILTLGAIVQDVRLAGVAYGLALGSDKVADYEAGMKYFGAIVGPIANRISNSRVRLDGMMYELERNEEGRTHLHSGAEGSHAQIWTIVAQTQSSVTLTLTMPDGMAGLPGHRQISVTYQVTAPATLTLEISGTTDATTVMNFASHIYWNLDGTPTWEGHSLRLAADHYTPVDETVCPTGEVANVTGTPMDFRQERAMKIGDPALDHNFCLSDAPTALRDVLWLRGQSGVSMSMATTEPGVQVHDASGSGRPGRGFYEGVVIEPQRWPDAPNNPHFPSIRVLPDATYHQTTRWTFEA